MKRRRELLAGTKHPAREREERRAPRLILRVHRQEDPGGPPDRIRVRSWRIREREAEVVRDLGGGGSPGDALGARVDEFARGVLDRGVWNVVLVRVGHLDVADRS